MSAVLGDRDAALIGQPADPEGREEAVQQAGVVGVLDVLEIELPVVVQYLRCRAEIFGLPRITGRYASR